MPAPKKGEERSKFISRCISEVSHEGKDRTHDQVIAMCHQIWRNRNKKSAIEYKMAYAIKEDKDGRHYHEARGCTVFGRGK